VGGVLYFESRREKSLWKTGVSSGMNRDKPMLKMIHSRHAIPILAILILIFISLTTGTAFRAWAETKEEASLQPPGKAADLVDVKEVNPRIIVDIKYATEDNFTKKKLYDSNTCFLRKSTAVKLAAVQKELERMNLGLKVWDCYRPLAVQRFLWAILPDERYVANPGTGSRHNRASAVDLTLVDSQGKELQMPTGFDDFSPRADHHYQDLPDQVIRNRELLKGLMEKAGFIPLPEEWWHYDDEKWMQFDLMDVPFQDLLKHQN
jgi:D-alanyl-D-alanine dipeptidase